MLKIGDFAHIGQVSVKTLHYYDRIGLLKPVRVDPYTGYRYYSVEQLLELNRILALKDLGLPLEQISLMLTGDLSMPEIRGMLRLRQAQLKEEIEGLKTELSRVEIRLRQIEMEDRMPDYDVVLKRVGPALVASRRLVISTNEEVPAYLEPAFEETIDHIAAHGGKRVGPGIARWHTSPDTYVDEEVEAIYPIDHPLPESDHVRVYTLPPEGVAATVHQGDFAEFTNGHRALLQWIEANGYQLSGAVREIYHSCDDHLASTIEIQFPVRRD